MFEGRAPFPIPDRFVRTGFNQQPDRLCVRVAAVAKHDRFHESRPANIVDVIQWRFGFDQRPDHVHVSEMCRGDQRRAVIGAGYRLRISTEVKRKRYHLYVVLYGSNRDGIVALIIHGAYVRTASDQRAHVFDDLGCALLWLDAEGAALGGAEEIWVRDLAGADWLDARAARFVAAEHTPMNYGFGAVAAPADAALALEQVHAQVREVEGGRRAHHR